MNLDYWHSFPQLYFGVELLVPLLSMWFSTWDIKDSRSLSWQHSFKDNCFPITPGYFHLILQLPISPCCLLIFHSFLFMYWFPGHCFRVVKSKLLVASVYLALYEQHRKLPISQVSAMDPMQVSIRRTLASPADKLEVWGWASFRKHYLDNRTMSTCIYTVNGSRHQGPLT